jgi:hypothetical protein
MSDPEASEATKRQEAAIGVTRQRLASEVDEVVERFKPAQIRRRVGGELRQKLAELVKLARRRPVFTAAIASGALALFIWRSRRRA